MQEKKSSFDMLGIQPFADAVNTITETATDGVRAFLGRICLPAAEEFGLLLHNKICNWRANNATSVTLKAEAMLKKFPGSEKFRAHPRIVGTLIDQASWCDDDVVQSMWAGLLATSCSDDGSDQSNLLFINTLTQLNTSEVRLLTYACEQSKKEKSNVGWILVREELKMSLDKLIEISGRVDIHRLDLELDHLRVLGLLWPIGGFHPESTDAVLSPTAFGLQLYVRGQGFIGSPVEYFVL